MDYNRFRPKDDEAAYAAYETEAYINRMQVLLSFLQGEEITFLEEQMAISKLINDLEDVKTTGRAMGEREAASWNLSATRKLLIAFNEEHPNLSRRIDEFYKWQKYLLSGPVYKVDEKKKEEEEEIASDWDLV